jgi:hypothetical protein
MSYPAIDLMRDAATLVGDPGMTRATPDSLLLALNRVQRDLAVRMNMFESEFLFDIAADHRYSYPPGVVRAHFVRVANGTDASDPDSFPFMDELVEEDWRGRIDGNYPHGTPTHYFARRGWFHLYPWPDDAVTGGGVLAAWMQPDNIIDPNIEYTQFPDMMRDYVVDGMMVTALQAIEQYAEAREHYANWLLRLPEIKGQVEDPSDDRRPSFRPQLTRRMGTPS